MGRKSTAVMTTSELKVYERVKKIAAEATDQHLWKIEITPDEFRTIMLCIGRPAEWDGPGLVEWRKAVVRPETFDGTLFGCTVHVRSAAAQDGDDSGGGEGA